MKHYSKHLSKLVVLAIVVILFGTIYAVGQQVLRLNANDPQIQMAEDTANALNNGSSVEELTTGSVDLEKSLAPFVIIYDKQGEIVMGNGRIKQAIPKVPVGVLHSSEGREYNAVTWQPANDIRIASVTVAANDYYVLSGRSLREVEKREAQLLALGALGLLASLSAAAVYTLIRRQTSPIVKASAAKTSKKAK